MSEIYEVVLGEWTLKLREPAAAGAPTLLLIHGWTGDENSMWVFTSQLQKDYFMVAPRAPFASRHQQHGGYSWIRREQISGWPAVEDFADGMRALTYLLDELAGRYPGLDFQRLDLVGFSEGAALAAAFACRYPGRVGRLALLAGFLPSGAVANSTDLSHMDVFIGHGTQDESVPVSLAREAAESLKRAGARVSHCESPVGHKLGADCMRALRQFLEVA